VSGDQIRHQIDTNLINLISESSGTGKKKTVNLWKAGVDSTQVYPNLSTIAVKGFSSRAGRGESRRGD